MSRDADLAALEELARANGVQAAYEDWTGRIRQATPDALVAALRALDVPIGSPGEAPDLLAAHHVDRWTRLCPPVAAATGGTSLPVEVRLPPSGPGRVEMRLTLEDGTAYEWSEDASARPPDRTADVRGASHRAYELHIRDLPYGYHRLEVQHGERSADVLLIAAPDRAYGAPDRPRRQWGVFLPLYALRTARDRGVGDLSDLEALASWTRARGGTIVGTLPLLPVYLGDRNEPFEPSPYSPVSRLFWNELHLDLSAAPEAARPALAGLDPPTAPDGSARLVDYAEVARRQRAHLRALSDAFFDAPGDRRGDLERFVDQRPDAERYALFRGAVARHGSRWWDWPGEVPDRDLGLDDVDLPTARMHLYAQLLAREQVGALSGRLRRDGMHPYLDLPIGAVADGFDVWLHREVFARTADTGAPPDQIFTGGQNWRFPPLHPHRLRESGYRYAIDVLRHHMELADVLRIDHVMGLHRLFWIPEGVEAGDGVYVRYPAGELYAIVCIESHRHGTRVVGEDLGTVPKEVEEALQARGVTRMYVVEYEARPDEYHVLPAVPDDAAASVGTHDMPPFVRWWRGRDIDDSVGLGLMDEGEAARARERRATVRWKVTELLRAEGLLDGDGEAAVLAGLQEWLARSDAPLVLLNLEDLWLEEEPQNVPGTSQERPNWRRRARLTLEEVAADATVAGIVGRVDRARRDR